MIVYVFFSCVKPIKFYTDVCCSSDCCLFCFCFVVFSTDTLIIKYPCHMKHFFCCCPLSRNYNICQMWMLIVFRIAVVVFAAMCVFTCIVGKSAREHSLQKSWWTNLRWSWSRNDHHTNHTPSRKNKWKSLHLFSNGGMCVGSGQMCRAFVHAVAVVVAVVACCELV